MQKKYKDLPVKPHQIKSKLWIFINCMIDNPSFSSQTKEKLVTKAAQFGSTCEIS
jgi:DNA topoisomerase-2